MMNWRNKASCYRKGWLVGGGSAGHPRSFKATARCTTEAVRSLKWRAVDCPNSSWKSIATPENLFANAAWKRRLSCPVEKSVLLERCGSVGYDQTSFHHRAALFFYGKKRTNFTLKQDFIGKTIRSIYLRII